MHNKSKHLIKKIKTHIKERHKFCEKLLEFTDLGRCGGCGEHDCILSNGYCGSCVGFCSRCEKGRYKHEIWETGCDICDVFDENQEEQKFVAICEDCSMGCGSCSKVHCEKHNEIKSACEDHYHGNENDLRCNDCYKKRKKIYEFFSCKKTFCNGDIGKYNIFKLKYGSNFNRFERYSCVSCSGLPPNNERFRYFYDGKKFYCPPTLRKMTSYVIIDNHISVPDNLRKFIVY